MIWLLQKTFFSYSASISEISSKSNDSKQFFSISFKVLFGWFSHVQCCVFEGSQNEVAISNILFQSNKVMWQFENRVFLLTMLTFFNHIVCRRFEPHSIVNPPMAIPPLYLFPNPHTFDNISLDNITPSPPNELWDKYKDKTRRKSYLHAFIINTFIYINRLIFSLK